MRRRVLKWMAGAAFSAVIILTYLLLYHTSLFSQLAIRGVNQFILARLDLKLAGRIEGGVLGRSFGLMQANLLSMTSGDTLIQAASLRLEGSGLDFDLTALSIEKLGLDGFMVDLGSFQQRLTTDDPAHRSLNLTIQEFTLQNGIIYSGISGSDSVLIESLAGDLWLLDGYTGINLQSAVAIIPSFNSDTLAIAGLIGHASAEGFTFDPLRIQSPSGSFLMNGHLAPREMDLKLALQSIQPGNYPWLEVPVYYQNISVDADLDIQRGPENLLISGTGRLNQGASSIPFQIQRYAQDASAKGLQLRVGSEYSYLMFSGSMDSLGNLEGNVDLFRPDLNPFIPVSGLTLTQPIGTLRFSGNADSLKLIPTLQQVTINGVQIDSFDTQLIYRGRHLLEILPGRLSPGANRLNFTGEVREGQYDLRAVARFTDYTFLLGPNAERLFSGDLDLDLQVSGALDNPHFSGTFSTRDLGLPQRLALSGMGKFDLQLQEGRILGEFALRGEAGSLFGKPLKKFSIATKLDESGFRLEEFHLQGSQDLVSLSGSYGSAGIDLNKLRMLVSGHQLKLVDSLHISRSAEGRYLIPPTVLSFNRGGFSLDGSYSALEGYQIKSQFDLLNVTQLMEFLSLEVDFKGMASGGAWVEGALLDPIIHADFLLLGGTTLGYPSDSARVDLTLGGDAANSNEVLAYSQGGKLKLIGMLPWGYKVRGDAIQSAPQNFAIQVENYLLSDLKFRSIAGQPLSGRATGTLSIRGTPRDTKMEGRVNLRDAKYDTLSFSRGYVGFSYEDELLTFDSLSMVSNWGYGTGSGFLPLSLDLMAKQRPDLSQRDLGLHFDFTLNEMPFLTSYISDIDVVQGDFIGDLSFSGPFAAPLRNGKLRGHNGRVEISVLGNPITDIHSEFTLVDNTLTIDHFDGRMLFSAGSALNIQGALGRATSFIRDLIGVKGAQNYKGQVTASGSLDLSSFFEPRFDVHLQADEVYYRSTDGLIEAIADANLQFSGQDTLDVTAIIPVARAVYYSNFESTESYQSSISRNNSSLFKYSLDTQFASDLLISNDQMDAEFEGELWLLDYGDGIMRFSGQLIAQEGGKFYYLGNELTINRGEIIFNSVDFNPQISMEASIEIDGELVTLILTGDLDEPELVIQTENSQLTQSDVLAYLTINQKLVEVSFDSRSALNPVKTYSEMLVEKQISKIGREFTGLDILDVAINLDSDTTAVSRFEVGQRLSKNLKVTYGGELQAVDGRSDYDFGLEYQINKNVSVTSKINQNGEVELNGRLKFTY